MFYVDLFEDINQCALHAMRTNWYLEIGQQGMLRTLPAMQAMPFVGNVNQHQNRA